MKEKAVVTLTCFHPALINNFRRFHEAEMLLLSDNTPCFRLTRQATEKLIIAEKCEKDQLNLNTNGIAKILI